MDIGLGHLLSGAGGATVLGLVQLLLKRGFDVTKDEIITTIHFESETGNPRYDPVSKHILVNLQDKNVIAEIDPATDKEVAEYPVGKCRGNHGMALDSEHRLAFLSCEENDLMTVFRLDTHQPIAYFPRFRAA